MRLSFPLVLIMTAMLYGCSTLSNNTHNDIEPLTSERALIFDQVFPELMKQHQIITMGVGVIKKGDLVWTGYYGEQSPGVAASDKTLFNVASITKTLTAETILRLAEENKLSLDESMAAHWVDPDVLNDPRHVELTPRMVLNHTTGFLNWRFFSADRTLKFINDPGTTYGYSGEGFEYLARFAERKLGQNFSDLVADYVFEPMDIRNASFDVKKNNFQQIARPVDSEGNFYGYYCRPNGWCRNEGDYSAADDLVISVEDYAKFLIATMNGKRLGKDLTAERNRIQISDGDDAIVNCDFVDTQKCPEAQGYGLGWKIFDYGDNKLISHGGSDWSEVALGYFYTRTGDGLVIFLNAPNSRALAAMSEAIALIDADSPLIGQYQRWHKNSLSQ